MLDLKTLLKNNTVSFAYYRKGYLYYVIQDPVTLDPATGWFRYVFPVPVDDIGDATFNATEKALLFMRYIRKAQEEGSFVRYHGN